WGETAVYERSIWKWLSSGLPAVGTFLAALGLYRWVPNTEVKWSQALSGASFVAVAWEGARRGFARYVRSSLVNYPLVYGSLGGVMALMLWIYVSSWLALFWGAPERRGGEKPLSLDSRLDLCGQHSGLPVEGFFSA
ncbi:MAG: YihY/virulence factor BrkB family protein, partial [Anaerolineae bacterium]